MPFSPDLTRLPTDADLISYLDSLGFTVTVQGAPQTLGTAIADFCSGTVAEVYEEFQRRTRRYPFASVGSVTDTDIFCDPPGVVSKMALNIWRGGEKVLVLPIPFISVTGVYIGITPLDSVGTILDPSVYAFRPLNYGVINVPINEIEFYMPTWGMQGAIRVNGVVASYDDFPADVWLAIIKGAAARNAEALGTLISGGILRWQEADASEFLSDSPFKQLRASWQTDFDNCVLRYTRVIY